MSFIPFRKLSFEKHKNIASLYITLHTYIICTVAKTIYYETLQVALNCETHKIARKHCYQGEIFMHLNIWIVYLAVMPVAAAKTDLGCISFPESLGSPHSWQSAKIVLA